MKEILITGGAGYIGSHSATALLNANYKVTILDDLSSGSLDSVDPRASFIKMDAFDEEALNQFLLDKPFDGVLHCAGEIVVSESIENPSKYVSSNVSGMNNLLKVLAINNIDKIVFSSTASLYGNSCTKFPAKETSPINPVNPYAETKHMGERLIYWMAKRYNWTYVIFRYFNVAGAEMNLSNGLRVKKPTHIIPSINKTLLGYNDLFYIFGQDYNTKDGTCVRDYIHVLDVAKAHVLAFDYLFKKNATSEIFNLGTETGYSVMDIYTIAKKLSDIEIPHKIIGRRAGDPDQILADTSKVKKYLNWQPTYKLKDIINSDFYWRAKMKDSIN